MYQMAERDRNHVPYSEEGGLQLLPFPFVSQPIVEAEFTQHARRKNRNFFEKLLLIVHEPWIRAFLHHITISWLSMLLRMLERNRRGEMKEQSIIFSDKINGDIFSQQKIPTWYNNSPQSSWARFFGPLSTWKCEKSDTTLKH